MYPQPPSPYFPATPPPPIPFSVYARFYSIPISNLQRMARDRMHGEKQNLKWIIFFASVFLLLYSIGIAESLFDTVANIFLTFFGASFVLALGVALFISRGLLRLFAYPQWVSLYIDTENPRHYFWKTFVYGLIASFWYWGGATLLLLWCIFIGLVTQSWTFLSISLFFIMTTLGMTMLGILMAAALCLWYPRHRWVNTGIIAILSLNMIISLLGILMTKSTFVALALPWLLTFGGLIVGRGMTFEIQPAMFPNREALPNAFLAQIAYPVKRSGGIDAVFWLLFLPIVCCSFGAGIVLIALFYISFIVGRFAVITMKRPDFEIIKMTPLSNDELVWTIFRSAISRSAWIWQVIGIGLIFYFIVFGTSLVSINTTYYDSTCAYDPNLGYTNCLYEPNQPSEYEKILIMGTSFVVAVGWWGMLLLLAASIVMLSVIFQDFWAVMVGTLLVILVDVAWIIGMHVALIALSSTIPFLMLLGVFIAVLPYGLTAITLRYTAKYVRFA